MLLYNTLSNNDLSHCIFYINCLVVCNRIKVLYIYIYIYIYIVNHFIRKRNSSTHEVSKGGPQLGRKKTQV
jgi:hypothetical protein